MKSLVITTSISEDYLLDYVLAEETPEEFTELAKYGIKARKVSVEEVIVSVENAPLLFDTNRVWIQLEIPDNKVSEIANLEGEADFILDGLRENAKKYLAESVNKPSKCRCKTNGMDERPTGYLRG